MAKNKLLQNLLCSCEIDKIEFSGLLNIGINSIKLESLEAPAKKAIEAYAKDHNENYFITCFNHDNLFIYLTDCSVGASKLNFSKIGYDKVPTLRSTKKTYVGDIAIQSKQIYNDKQSIAYDSVSFEFTHLNSFVQSTYIKGDSLTLVENMKWVESNFVLKKENEFCKTYTGKGYVISIKSRFVGDLLTLKKTSSRNQIPIEEVFYVEVSKVDKSKVNLSEIREIGGALKLFLAICLKNQVNFVTIKALNDGFEDEIIIRNIEETEIELKTNELEIINLQKGLIENNMNLAECIEKLIFAEKEMDWFLDGVYCLFNKPTNNFRLNIVPIITAIDVYTSEKSDPISEDINKILNYLIESLDSSAIGNSRNRSKIKSYIEKYYKPSKSLKERIELKIKDSNYFKENYPELVTELDGINKFRNNLFHGNHIESEVYSNLNTRLINDILTWFFWNYIGFSSEQSDSILFI
jgi:hypothetical protein